MTLTTDLSVDWAARKARTTWTASLVVNILGHADIYVTQVVSHDLRPCAFAQRMAWNAWCESSSEDIPYCWRPSPNLSRNCLPRFSGKSGPGRVGATSATDVPTLAFTGVARKEWILPTSGPLRTVAMPEICPRSLILLAMVAKRLESAGNSVLRSVITPFCQMKACDQLKFLSNVLPTTWPRLLIPVARAA